MDLSYVQPDADTDFEPDYHFTKEVRDLFQVSLIADNQERGEYDEHESNCLFFRSQGRERCTCPVAPFFHIGRRPNLSLSLEGFAITPKFHSRHELEKYCEENIDSLRSRALAATKAS
jgi:hypothetical protein